MDIDLPNTLQGLKFDLIVFSPYKAVDGFLEDVRQAAAEAHSNDGAAAAARHDPGLAGLDEGLLARARAAAYAAADTLMLSDAPLLHAPGRLALAAVRSAFNKVGLRLSNRASCCACLLTCWGSEGCA